MTASALHAKGIALTRTASTDQLVASFDDTDALMDEGGLTSGQYAQLATTRGWIMTVLEERGELDRVMVLS